MTPTPEPPRTVLRGAPLPAEGPGQEVFDRLAEPVLAYADRLANVTGERERDLTRHGAVLLDRFAAGLQREGVPGPAVMPARLALALVLDTRARGNRALDVHRWAEDAQRLLFEGHSVTTTELSGFVHRAQGAGPDYRGVAGFLSDCLARLEADRRRFSTAPRVTSWTGIVVVLAVAYLGAILAWVFYTEWRFHGDLTRVFQAEALEIGLDRQGFIPDLAPRLDRMALALERVRAAEEKVPVALFAGPFGMDAAVKADEAYRDAVSRHLPQVLAQAIHKTLATEGDPLRLYDTLRAWNILRGEGEWSAAWLVGWVEDRVAADPSLAGLAPHVRHLGPPTESLPAADPELVAQALVFAADAAESDRAWLELRRSAAVAALTDWRADRLVPDLATVLVRRSGAAVGQPLPGLFTQAGWDHARDFGAGLAVTEARRQARLMFPAPLAERNDAPDLVMDRLQAETMAHWSGYLADLRVREFASPDASVRISGLLALKNSPLRQLLQEVWVQVGGTDRRRSHAQQLQIAAEFGPMIQYIEQGGIDRIAGLFAGLNVALGAMDRSEETGQQRLMSAQERAASVAALDQAPRIVVQIVEDTLVQTGAAHADQLSNPLTKSWQVDVLPVCQEVAAGRFPFVAGGPDADPAAVARLLGPGGAIDGFLRRQAEQALDTSESPWRWRPEARFEGLSPDSAIFLQRARTLQQGLFGPGGRLGATVTLSALAERGKASMAIGGTGGPVEATTDSLVLDWPGPDPAAGAEVRFETGAASARLAEPGPWGMLRLLGGLRLREREGGQRMLVDLRSSGARLFLEIRFDRPANPLSLRKLLDGFSCPPML